MISDKAVIHATAKLGKGVEVGPFAVIGAGVEIGDDCYIGPHVVLEGPTHIGNNNQFYQFSSIGVACQDKKYHGEQTILEIGDNNIFREGCTVHRGTLQGGGITKIGNHNLFMVNTHVAHDCIIGNHVVFSNNASIAGHVVVGDYANLGGFVGVHQFCSIGAYSFSAGGSIIFKDVAPFVTVSGYPAQAHGLNTIGLERNQFSKEVMSHLKAAYKVIFKHSKTVKDAVEQLSVLAKKCQEVELFVEFLQGSARGIVR